MCLYHVCSYVVRSPQQFVFFTAHGQRNVPNFRVHTSVSSFYVYNLKRSTAFPLRTNSYSTVSSKLVFPFSFKAKGTVCLLHAIGIRRETRDAFSNILLLYLGKISPLHQLQTFCLVPNAFVATHTFVSRAHDCRFTKRKVCMTQSDVPSARGGCEAYVCCRQGTKHSTSVSQPFLWTPKYPA